MKTVGGVLLCWNVLLISINLLLLLIYVGIKKLLALIILRLLSIGRDQQLNEKNIQLPKPSNLSRYCLLPPSIEVKPMLMDYCTIELIA